MPADNLLWETPLGELMACALNFCALFSLVRFHESQGLHLFHLSSFCSAAQSCSKGLLFKLSNFFRGFHELKYCFLVLLFLQVKFERQNSMTWKSRLHEKERRSSSKELSDLTHKYKQRCEDLNLAAKEIKELRKQAELAEKNLAVSDHLDCHRG